MASAAEASFARPWLALAITAALTAAAATYSVARLGVDTDTTSMLSAKLPFRQAYEQHRAAFPQLNNLLLVVVESPSRTAARDAAAQLAERLRRAPAIAHVGYLSGSPFLRRNGLLFRPTAKLETLLDRLEASAPLIGALAQNPDLRGMAGVLGLIVEEAGKGDTKVGDPRPLARMVGRVAQAFEQVGAGLPDAIDWGAVLEEDGDGAIAREIVEVQPKQDFGSLDPAGAAIRSVNAIVRELGLEQAAGLRVRLTGGPALARDELRTVESNIGLAGLLSLVLVGAVLLCGLRSPRLAVAILVTVVVGLVWTAGFAALAIGKLNLISVAFAVYFIALGVDFGIHLGLGHGDSVAAGAQEGAALGRAARRLVGPLSLCMASTAVAFLAFVPTTFRGIAELGIISAFGMACALGSTYLLLPALIRLLRPRFTARPARVAEALRSLWWPERHPRAVLAVSAALAVASLAALPFLRFDWDPIELQGAGVPSVVAFRDLASDSRTTPMRGIVLAASRAEAESLVPRLSALPSVAGTVTLRDFVPSDQATKLARIADARELLEPVLQGPPAPTGEDIVARRREAIAIFASRATALPPTADQALRQAAARLRQAIVALPRDPSGAVAPDLLERLDRAVAGSVPSLLRDLTLALSAGPVAIDDLPAEIVRRFVAADGRARIEVLPREVIDRQERMLRFAKDLFSVAPAAIGAPAMLYASGRAVIEAFAEALAGALLAIAALLYLHFRRWRDVCLVLAPLVLAALLTNAYGVLLGKNLNFANVIVIPLLLGIGVAGAIHLLAHHRYGSAEVGAGPYRPLIVSFLSTLFAFATLAISSHRGTASLGELHAVSVIFSLITTVTLLPALLALERPQAPEPESRPDGR
ncbi:MAG: MMPL family transporter [Alphaproteobacteria bacterium]|nr:MMPL family transporter [Alphaproteobacteria bacterium]